MDKKFVKKYNLNEDVKRFNKILNYKSPRQSLKEYTFYNSSIKEDDQDMQQQNDGQQPDMMQGQQQGQQPMQQGGQGQMPMDNGQGQGSMDDGQGQMPMDDGQDMGMGMDAQMPMDNGQGQSLMDDGQDMSMDDGQGQSLMSDDQEMPMDDGEVETTEMEEGDEVIDVDELTQAQEETDNKMDVVDDRLTKLLSVVKELGKALNDNNEKIDNLQGEFEKRNPTEQEKLNLRSQHSYPYNQTPRDYWDNKKAADPRYNVIYDNDVSPAKEEEKYELKRSDLDGLDMKSIADTLNIDQKLEDYLKF